MLSQQQIMWLMGIFFAVVWWSHYKMSKNALCSYTNVAKQEIEKWVPINGRYVIFGKKRFQLDPSKVKLIRWTRGFLFMIFPMNIFKYEFTWDSDEARDPNAHQTTIFSPEARFTANQEEIFRGVNTGLNAQAGGGKKSIMDRYGVWIAVLGLAVVAFLWYQDHQQTAAIMNYLKVLPPGGGK